MRKIGPRKLSWTYGGIGLEIKKASLSCDLYFNFNYKGKFIVHLFYMVNTEQSHVLENPVSVYVNSHSLAGLRA